MRADTQCPGCGARNAPEARVCEWCGRAFLLRDQPRRGRWLWVAGAGMGALVAAILVGVAVLTTAGMLPRLGSAPPAPTPVATRPPDATPAPAVAERPPEPTPEPTEYVRVTNTAGQGIILRREPSTSAPRVAARAENTVLQVVGPDTSAEGRTWRQVQDAQGNRGWVPGEFLAPAPAPGS